MINQNLVLGWVALCSRVFKEQKKPLFFFASIVFIGGAAWAINELQLSFESLKLWPGIVLIFIVGPLTSATAAFGLQLSGRAIGFPLSFSHTFHAANLGVISELLPLPGGAIVRIGVLANTGASVQASVWITTVSSIMWLAISATLAGVVIMPFSYVIGSLFSITGFGMACVCLMWIAHGASLKWAVAIFLHRFFNLILSIVRILIAFWMLGESASFSGAAVVSFSAVLGSASSIAPAGFGVGEVFAALLATLVTTSPALAFIVVAVNRVMGLISSGLMLLPKVIAVYR